jgi:kynureninase
MVAFRCVTVAFVLIGLVPGVRGGVRAEEVVVMNSLTVNLHLLMVSFYRPTSRRHAIVIEDSAFPPDSYAVRSQAAFHGYNPDETVIRLSPGGARRCCAPMTWWISCARTGTVSLWSCSAR